MSDGFERLHRLNLERNVIFAGVSSRGVRIL